MTDTVVNDVDDDEPDTTRFMLDILSSSESAEDAEESSDFSCRRGSSSSNSLRSSEDADEDEKSSEFEFESAFPDEDANFDNRLLLLLFGRDLLVWLDDNDDDWMVIEKRMLKRAHSPPDS